jgi:2-hydroxycyclohexanecarboxyl-CoA dehydrogenase
MVADRLSGQRALVTGGAKGIGAAIVERLAAERAEVTFCDIDRAAGEALAARTGARFLELDVAQVEAVASAVAKSGPFEILVVNAGIDQHAFHTETKPEDWRRLLAVNLESGFAFAAAVLPAMQAAGHGRIVFIASEAGRVGSKGGAVYAAAKAGQIGFARSLARENARFAITVNAVLPGPIDTPMLRDAVASGGEKLLEVMAGATLMRRLGQPEDVAAAVAYLASREAGYVTGEVLGVSGGMALG